MSQYINTLEIRKTHKYVGEYQHLDLWTEIGTYKLIGSEETSPPDREYDQARSFQHYVLVDAEADSTPEQIEQALRDTFSNSGCACEHDCCGCVSTRAYEASVLTGTLWIVKTSSTANY